MRHEELTDLLKLLDEIQRDSFDVHALGEQSRARRRQRCRQLEVLCTNLQLEPARFSMAEVDRYPYDVEAAMSRRQIFVQLGALPDGAPRRERAKPAR